MKVPSPSQRPVAAGRDHGGDLDTAIRAHGGRRQDWIDLSTGINRRPYPVPPLAPEVWARLPETAATDRLLAASRRYLRTPEHAGLVAASGAQALIQACPLLRTPGRVGIVEPTYNEHRAAFTAAGWEVVALSQPEEAAPLDALVVVNPNNPDGRRYEPVRLAALSARGVLVVVDESFADPEPTISAVSTLDRRESGDLVILRSFGKFFGLAGLRLGLAVSSAPLTACLAERLGPWSVSGPALAIGTRAYGDERWIEATRRRLGGETARLDAIAAAAGWRLIGGAALFRTYDVGDAAAVQGALAGHRIWSRAFDYAPAWLRLGLPGAESEWTRLEGALGT
ncbi:MAG: threonine-phosphate decarboxylase CobD [Pseudomonadota bacterium]